MKRCPSCQRSYPDDRMSNCPHDGAPLAPAAYTPPGPPQGYPPPGYQQAGAPWQNQNYQQPNYPPPQNYPPPGYQPQAAWQGATSQFVPCPRCGRPGPEQVKFTWWGGMIGPRMLSHVKCPGCGLEYNGKTGLSNSNRITLYFIVTFVISLGLGLLILLLVVNK